MTAPANILQRARHALAGEPRLERYHDRIALFFVDGVMTAEGKLDDVAAKRLALARIAAVPGVTGIVDRLRVAAAQPMEDGQIRDLVRDALVGEPALANIAVRELVKGEWLTAREYPAERGDEIRIAVADGIVTLSGDVPGLAQKRLAGVLAWWVPGAEDVVNGIAVTPPEEDNDEEVTEAVRIALEKDPFVDASQLHVRTTDHVVLLEGLVPSDAQRHMAESDAWYVFAVDDVDNRIAVQR